MKFALRQAFALHLAKRAFIKSIPNCTGYLGHEIPVFIGKNILLTLRQQQIGQSIPHRIGYLSQPHSSFTTSGMQADVPFVGILSGECLLPVKSRGSFLSGRKALDRLVLLQCNFTKRHVWVAFGFGCF